MDQIDQCRFVKVEQFHSKFLACIDVCHISGRLGTPSVAVQVVTGFLGSGASFKPITKFGVPAAGLHG